MGARAYRYLSLYKPDPGCLIETGSERGEGSTAFLAAYAKRHDLVFYTADPDIDTYAAAKTITPGARHQLGRELLGRIKRPVSAAYLDGADWIPAGEEREEWIQP